MNKWNPILETFLRQDEGLFDDEPEDLEALRVTVRIAADFHEFLTKWDDKPPDIEIDYIVGTIRAGIDFFFSISSLYRILDTSRAKRTFAWDVTSNFADMRRSFLSLFSTLASEELEFTERLACLLTLSKVQLAFLAGNFSNLR